MQMHNFTSTLRVVVEVSLSRIKMLIKKTDGGAVYKRVNKTFEISWQVYLKNHELYQSFGQTDTSIKNPPWASASKGERKRQIIPISKHSVSGLAVWHYMSLPPICLLWCLMGSSHGDITTQRLWRTLPPQTLAITKELNSLLVDRERERRAGKL